MNPVEANQTVLRAQPQETVVRLENGVNGWLKETFFFSPNAMRVLRERLVWIECVRRQTEQQSQSGQHASKSTHIMKLPQIRRPSLSARILCRMAGKKQAIRQSRPDPLSGHSRRECPLSILSRRGHAKGAGRSGPPRF